MPTVPWTPSQKSGIRSYAGDAFTRFFWYGPTGCGKGLAASYCLIMECLRKDIPDEAVFFIMGFYLYSSENTLIPQIMGLSKRLGVSCYRKYGNLYVNGHMIRILTGSSAKDYQGFGGSNFAGGIIDEVSELAKPAVDYTLTRIRGIRRPKLFLLTNPGHEKHWAKEAYMDRHVELDMAVQFFYREIRGLREYYATIEKAYMPGSLFHRRYVLGEWATGAGAVYPIYEIVDPLTVTVDDSKPAYAGLDWGFTGTTAGILIQSLTDGRLAITDGYTHIGNRDGIVDDKAHAAAMLRRWPFIRSLGVDSTAHSLILECRNLGIPTRSVTNSLDVLHRTQGALANGSLVILDTPATQPLRDELPGYHFPVNSNDEAMEDQWPVKNADHSIDGMHYACERALPKVLRSWTPATV